MFNEYGVYQMMKIRQEETERNAREAWKHYIEPSENNSCIESSDQSTISVSQCCQYVCASC